MKMKLFLIVSLIGFSCSCGTQKVDYDKCPVVTNLGIDQIQEVGDYDNKYVAEVLNRLCSETDFPCLTISDVFCFSGNTKELVEVSLYDKLVTFFRREHLNLQNEMLALYNKGKLEGEIYTTDGLNTSQRSIGSTNLYGSYQNGKLYKLIISSSNYKGVNINMELDLKEQSKKYQALQAAYGEVSLFVDTEKKEVKLYVGTRVIYSNTDKAILLTTLPQLYKNNSYSIIVYYKDNNTEKFYNKGLYTYSIYARTYTDVHSLDLVNKNYKYYKIIDGGFYGNIEVKIDGFDLTYGSMDIKENHLVSYRTYHGNGSKSQVYSFDKNTLTQYDEYGRKISTDQAEYIKSFEVPSYILN